MVCAYALMLTSKFFAYNEGFKQQIIDAKYGENIEALKTELWYPYYQELTEVSYLIAKSIPCANIIELASRSLSFFGPFL